VGRKGVAARLDPNIERELRTSHFKVTDRETADKTGKAVYRSDYNWKINTQDF